MTAFKDWLNGLTSKTTPVDADELYVRDSSGTPGSKKLTWANLKATLANTFLSLTGGTVAGGTRTTSGSTLTITETLNNAGVTFPGALVLDVTDTASAAGSLLADYKVGGVSKLRISKAGKIDGAADSDLFSGNTVAFPGYVRLEGGIIAFGVPGAVSFLMEFATSQKMVFGSAGSLAWSSSTGVSATTLRTNADLYLVRDAANTLAQRNGTNAQTYRTYGTYTDASNYRRVALAMTTAGVATLTPEGAGTGASGNVLHISGLPTSNPGAGILWNDSGTVKVGT